MNESINIVLTFIESELMDRLVQSMKFDDKMLPINKIIIKFFRIIHILPYPLRLDCSSIKKELELG